MTSYFHCEICGVQLAHQDETNEGKFPVRRVYQDPLTDTGLLSVRCVDCTELPYRLEEGQAFRTTVLNRDDVTVLRTNEYSYRSFGIGHLLELFESSPSEQDISAIKSGPIEVGFLTYDDANLIILAYRFIPSGWNVTPYFWHAYRPALRGIPPINPRLDADRKFSIGLVDSNGGKYRAIREGTLPFEFATVFHGAINDQIASGIPPTDTYRQRIDQLYQLIIDNKVDSMLSARCEVN